MTRFGVPSNIAVEDNINIVDDENNEPNLIFHEGDDPFYELVDIY